ncbi:hypothetical protein [Streptomyces sp. NPDC048282]|uniref:hypothetical protein n=1 Tax=Streptomyces sp. NPDC048282 TaxID=3365528 RepID=UPI0037154633
MTSGPAPSVGNGAAAESVALEALLDALLEGERRDDVCVLDIRVPVADGSGGGGGDESGSGAGE